MPPDALAGYQVMLHRYYERATAAEAAARRLGEALAPFVKMADWWDTYRPGAPDDATVSAWGLNLADVKRITLGQLRAIRSAARDPAVVAVLGEAEPSVSQQPSLMP